MDDPTIRFTTSPEIQPPRVGDQVDCLADDGVAVLYVLAVEPAVDGSYRVTFGPEPPHQHEWAALRVLHDPDDVQMCTDQTCRARRTVPR